MYAQRKNICKLAQAHIRCLTCYVYQMSSEHLGRRCLPITIAITSFPFCLHSFTEPQKEDCYRVLNADTTCRMYIEMMAILYLPLARFLSLSLSLQFYSILFHSPTFQ